LASYDRFFNTIILLIEKEVIRCNAAA